MTKSVYMLMCIWCVVFSGQSVRAFSFDLSKEATFITSDRAIYDKLEEKNGKKVVHRGSRIDFEGRVTVSNEQMRLWADAIRITFDTNNAPLRVIARGNTRSEFYSPREVKDQSGKSKTIVERNTTQSDLLQYDLTQSSNRVLYLTMETPGGLVRLTQGSNTMRGGSATLWVDEGRYEIKNGVRMHVKDQMGLPATGSSKAGPE